MSTCVTSHRFTAPVVTLVTYMVYSHVDLSLMILDWHLYHMACSVKCPEEEAACWAAEIVHQRDYLQLQSNFPLLNPQASIWTRRTRTLYKRWTPIPDRTFAVSWTSLNTLSAAGSIHFQRHSGGLPVTHTYDTANNPRLRVLPATGQGWVNWWLGLLSRRVCRLWN